MLLTLLLLVVPGALIGRALRLPWTWVLMAAAPLTFGLIGTSTVVLGVLGVGWNLLTLAVSAAVATAAAALLGRTLLPGPVPGEHDPRRLLLPGLGVAAGVLLIAVTTVRGLLSSGGRLDAVPQPSDQQWHGNAVRYIAETGIGSPLQMGGLLNPETLAPHYYPLALHDLIAVVVQITGVLPTLALNLASLTMIALLVPLGAAGLGWCAGRGAGQHQRALHTAGVAALLSGVVAGVPHIELSLGVLPNLIGLALAGALTALLISCVREPRRWPAAALAVVGAVSVHPTGLVMTSGLVALWWLLSGGREVGRLRAGVRLAVPVGVGLLVLAPQLRALVFYGGEITNQRYFYSDDARTIAVQAVLQQTRIIDQLPPPWAVLVLALVGLVAAVRWGAAWLPVAWGGLVLITVHTASNVPGVLGSVLQVLAGGFYSDTRRVSAATTVVLVPLAAVGTVTLARWIGARTRPSARVPALTAALAVVVAAASAGTVVRIPEVYAETWGGAIVSPSDREAFAALAEMPGAREGLVLNTPVDGTGWMYAEQGVRPVFAHYARGATGVAQRLLEESADAAGTNPLVGAALRKLDVRYVMTSSPPDPRYPVPRGFDNLDQAPGLEQVYDNGEAQIYRVR